MITRRNFFAASAATAAVSTLSSRAQADIAKAGAQADYVIKNHGIKHTVMGWCFNPMNTLELAKHCKAIGLKGMEGIDRKYYLDVKALGMDISLVGSHGFAKGPCDPKYYDESVKSLQEAIDVAASVGSKKVITFTGMKFDGMDQHKAIADCLRCWKTVIKQAEEKGITLVLEHLNSRDGSKPMMGHPGYFGDDVDFCFDLVKQMGSPNFKLLFDIYHVQIMNGDVIRRVQTNHDLIGHYHTAGNPGRCELDENQEINYPAIIKAIIATGYDDFLAHEFIPTWSDPILALRHGAMVCDF